MAPYDFGDSREDLSSTYNAGKDDLISDGDDGPHVQEQTPPDEPALSGEPASPPAAEESRGAVSLARGAVRHPVGPILIAATVGCLIGYLARART